jgi:hypothetical protein
MAESTLSITFSELLRHVARELGWPRQTEYSTGTVAIAAGVVTLTGGTFPVWDADKMTFVYGGTYYTVSVRTDGTHITLTDTSLTVAGPVAYALYNLIPDTTRDAMDIVKSGLRMVYVPLPLDGHSHRWSFMDPVATLYTSEPYSTGTIGVVNGVATLTGGTWPTWAAMGGALRVGGVHYSVSARTSGTLITVADTELDVDAGTSYELVQGTYQLPDDFGSLIGDLSYRASQSNFFTTIRQRSEPMLRNFRAGYPATGTPQFYAIAPTEQPASTTTGQRWTISFDVPTDARYAIGYRYSRLPEMIDTANQYPLGGMRMAEVYKDAVLAAAEKTLINERGVHYAAFLESLKAAIELDRLEQTPDSVGRDYGDEGCYPTLPRTYNGVRTTINGVVVIP